MDHSSRRRYNMKREEARERARDIVGMVAKQIREALRKPSVEEDFFYDFQPRHTGSLQGDRFSHMDLFALLSYNVLEEEDGAVAVVEFAMPSTPPLQGWLRTQSLTREDLHRVVRELVATGKILTSQASPLYYGRMKSKRRRVEVKKTIGKRLVNFTEATTVAPLIPSRPISLVVDVTDMVRLGGIKGFGRAYELFVARSIAGLARGYLRTLADLSDPVKEDSRY